MKHVKLGNTGLDVSRLCLGCMGFGQSENWVHNPWGLDEMASCPIIRKALELGINFFDTANVYAKGNSEEILGRALKEYANATKAWGQMHPGPNGSYRQYDNLWFS